MDFPSNSNKDLLPPKAERPKVEKIVVGEVVTRRKPLGRRVKDIFFGGDFKSASRYIGADVLLPALRNMIVDTATKGIERVIYGDSTVGRRRIPEYRPRVQYNAPLRRDPRDRVYLPDQPPRIPGGTAHHDIGDVILSSREEAEMVVEKLVDVIDKYDTASVADLYDMLGLPSTHIDNKWGWSTVMGIAVRQVREGYVIDLPPVEAI